MSKAATAHGLPAALTGGASHRYPSDETRAARRRRQKLLTPKPQTPQEIFAGRLLELSRRAPDEQARIEIRRVVHNLRLRFRGGCAERRFAIVAAPPQVHCAGGAAPALVTSEEQRRAADFAQDLLWLGDAAPDEQSDREINAVVRGIMLRFSPDENRQRLAVLKVLESSELLSLSEIVEQSTLSEECVLAILGDFTDPEVGLAFETTQAGKRKCGRNGTTRYFGLKH